jgi:catechol 2,3-dioxygenase-like lactoylglutathione lyase family enzyme
MSSIILDQINLVCEDVEASLDFYRALGLDIPEESVFKTASGAHHVDVKMPGGIELAFDSVTMAGAYNQGYVRQPDAAAAARNSVLGFRVTSSAEVDRTCASLSELGHPVLQPPYNAFWGSRYAIVADPDGNPVGIMSPPEARLRMGPPDI